MSGKELWELKGWELITLLKQGELTAEEAVGAFLKRIEAVDAELGAFLEIREDEALKRARDIDRLRASGEDPGPLGGVPVAVKDNICVSGMRCTCGSRLLEGWRPPYDATVVRALKEAGAVIIGKTNLDEFAMGSSTENSALRITRNPWDLTRVPGGSSGGSAAAVAAGEVPLALGSDTGGSVRQPAAFTGICGFKPTYGTVSRYGLVAFASSLDQIGPMAADVRDVALLMDVIAGRDPMDSTSGGPKDPGYLRGLGGDLKGIRGAVPGECLAQGVSGPVLDSFKQALLVLEDLGMRIEEVSFPSMKYALDCYYVIATAEASSNLARFDGVRYGCRAEAHDMEDMYSKTRRLFGREVKRRILLGTFVLSTGYYDAYYLQAARVRTLVRRDFDRLFQDFDVILSPTTPTTAFLLGERIRDPLSMYAADVMTVPANLAGLPAISVPCGYEASSGPGGGNPAKLPVGLQILGPRFGDHTVLKVADLFYRKVAPQIERELSAMRKMLSAHTGGRSCSGKGNGR